MTTPPRVLVLTDGQAEAATLRFRLAIERLERLGLWVNV